MGWFFKNRMGRTGMVQINIYSYPALSGFFKHNEKKMYVAVSHSGRFFKISMRIMGMVHIFMQPCPAVGGFFSRP